MSAAAKKKSATAAKRRRFARAAQALKIDRRSEVAAVATLTIAVATQQRQLRELQSNFARLERLVVSLVPK